MFTQSNVRALGYEAKVHCESGSCWPASHRPPGHHLQMRPNARIVPRAVQDVPLLLSKWKTVATISSTNGGTAVSVYCQTARGGRGTEQPLANSKVPIKRSNHQSCGRQTDQLSHIGASSTPVFISTSAASRLTRRC